MMLLKQASRIFAFLFLVWVSLFPVSSHAEAALLMEEPYGLFGTLNPTGHNAFYFDNICADTPVHLRRCRPGELGAVISRYGGVNGYDWVAIPLVPYLYSVESTADVPQQVTRKEVQQLRNEYRLEHFTPIGIDKPSGRYVRNGWTQLIGAAYERRIYGFRFKTTPEQDDALIARLNDLPNVSHFQMLFRNCADFTRLILNSYFPDSFHRSIFPDAGITTPKQVTYKLVRYARKHPDVQLTVFEIPQVPGYRWHSHSNKNIAESFSTTAYAIPLTFVNPYLAGCIFVDYLFRGHYHLIPRHPQVISPQNLIALTTQTPANENAAGAAPQASDAASAATPEAQQEVSSQSEDEEQGLKEGAATQ